MPLNAGSGSSRMPVLVVTGFLGSGKTTLLRKALRDKRFARSLVLVNEAAPTGIDDRVIGASPARAVRLLGNGCLCCAIQEDLRQSLLDVVDDPSLTSRIERIVIETSGLADPVSAIATLAAHPRLARALQLQAVVTVIDAQQALEQADEFVEFGAQAEAADLFVLAKSRLASGERIGRTRELLACLNPLAEACDADAPSVVRKLASVDTRQPATGPAPAPIRGWLPRPGIAAGTGGRLIRISSRSPEPARHTANVTAFTIHLDDPVDWIRFSTWFSAMLHAHGRRMLRVKGVLALRETPEPVLLNAVRHVVHFPEHLASRPDDARGSSLVFIVRDLAPDEVLLSLRAFVTGETDRHEPMARSEKPPGDSGHAASSRIG
ncbi:MAG: GTP-binding protein [Pseudomonadota bacterium]|nr:GTP-binding protein [Pseudomonadota bacterium]